LENKCTSVGEPTACYTLVRYGLYISKYDVHGLKRFAITQETRQGPAALPFEVNCSILHTALHSCLPSLLPGQPRLANCCGFCSGLHTCVQLHELTTYICSTMNTLTGCPMTYVPLHACNTPTPTPACKQSGVSSQTTWNFHLVSHDV